MTILRIIWRELSRPTIGGNWYAWATIALSHVMLGAALAMLIGPLWAIIGYAVVKEARDLMRGGRFWDSVVDTGFVVLGTFYGLAWMPFVAFAAVFIGVVIWITHDNV